jgi:hypothetical protein
MENLKRSEKFTLLLSGKLFWRSDPFLPTIIIIGHQLDDECAAELAKGLTKSSNSIVLSCDGNYKLSSF